MSENQIGWPQSNFRLNTKRVFLQPPLLSCLNTKAARASCCLTYCQFHSCQDLFPPVTLLLDKLSCWQLYYSNRTPLQKTCKLFFFVGSFELTLYISKLFFLTWKILIRLVRIYWPRAIIQAQSQTPMNLRKGKANKKNRKAVELEKCFLGFCHITALVD